MPLTVTLSGPPLLVGALALAAGAFVLVLIAAAPIATLLVRRRG